MDEVNAGKVCLEDLEKLETDLDFGPLCKGAWDSLLCWPPALPGLTMRLPCPRTIQDTDDIKFAFRVCGHDGEWVGGDKSQIGGTNYSQCLLETRSIQPALEFNNSWNMSYDPNLTIAEQNVGALAIIHDSVDVIAAIFLTISFILLLASLVILFCLKSFKGTRVRIYRSLFLAFLFHDASELVIRYGRALHFQDVVNGGDSCVALGVLVTLTSAAIQTWMALCALYFLLTAKGIVVNKKMYLVICLLGWFVPAILTITWLMVSVLEGDLKCWYGELYLSRVEHSFWVIEAPKIAVMLLTMAFLACFFVVYNKRDVQRHHPQEKHLMVELHGIKRNGIKMTFIVAYFTIAHVFYLVYIQANANEVFSYTVATALFSRGILLSIILCFSETDVSYSYNINEEQAQ